MAVKKHNAKEMHERILQSALEVFAEKGYPAATIKDISNRAECNTVTIFRHFEDKMSLFLQVAEHFSQFRFDKERLQARLSYLNLRNDLRIMADYFFETLYQNINIMKIFISDGHNFEPVSKYLWFIPEELKIFMTEYLEDMYMDRLTEEEIYLDTEMFLCFIIRTCLRIGAHDEDAGNYRQLQKESKKVLSQSVDMMVDLLLLKINSPG